MIRKVFSSKLRQIISDLLDSNIEKYCTKSGDHFFNEFEDEPTDDEIDDFIMSALCFDDIIRNFLLSNDEFRLLDDEEIEAFKDNVSMCIENDKYT